MEGVVGGILQICLGPSKIGEKVVFTRDVVHINGLNMRRADISHVLRHNDKVQVRILIFREKNDRFADYIESINFFQSLSYLWFSISFFSILTNNLSIFNIFTLDIQ